jgi:outer membrane protein TolC
VSKYLYPFFVLLALLAAAYARADSVLTLETAVTEGLERSPDLQRARAVVEESRWRHTEMLGSGFLPKISGGASHYFDVTKYQLTDIFFGGSEFQIPGIFPNNELHVGAVLPLFDGLSNVRRLGAASLSEEASEQELSHAEFELAEQIQLSFYQALAAADLELVAAQNVRTLEDHMREVEVQHSGGTATSYDTLRVSVQLNEARSDSQDATDTAALARKKLTQLLGLEQDDRKLQGTIPTPDESRVKSIELTAVPSERADLRALDLRAQAAEREHGAEGAWWVPSLSLAGQFSYYDLLLYTGTSTVDNHNFQTAYSLGVVLSWNLFDGGVSFSRAKESDARKLQAEKSAEAAKLQVPFDFAYWKRRYVSNSYHFKSKQLDVKRSQESVRLAKDEARAGTRTSSEVLDAELDLFRSQAGVVNAQVNAAEALIRLELALGRRIGS